MRKEGEVCDKGLKFANERAVFSRTSHLPGITPDVGEKIGELMKGKEMEEKESSPSEKELFSYLRKCEDPERIEKRKKEEEKEEKMRYRVRYNDHVRVAHKNTGLRMISRGNYRGGSKNQRVFAYYQHELLADYGWHIRNPNDLEDKDFIKDGSSLFFKHDNSDTFLYSVPGARSPVSNQQEICTGLSQEQLHNSDIYVVRVLNGTYLNYYQEFMLFHEETGCYLQTSHRYPYADGAEISCSLEESDDNIFLFVQRH